MNDASSRCAPENAGHPTWCHEDRPRLEFLDLNAVLVPIAAPGAVSFFSGWSSLCEAFDRICKSGFAFAV